MVSASERASARLAAFARLSASQALDFGNAFLARKESVHAAQ
jgi:hypothetical protein